MIIKIVTLFPSMYEGFLSESIIKRAINNEVVKVEIIDLRKYSKDKHHRVDDTPYGGGAGMVISPVVVYDCLNDIKTDKSYIILMSPQGNVYSQKKAINYTKYEELILLCGHYEGFDERVLSMVDEEVSIGDYVLTGGELPSMIISDSIIRLLDDGAITKESYETDSFQTGLLEHPQYTRPVIFNDIEVPFVLQNGNHKEIAKYSKKESLRKTYLRRPDLLKDYEMDREEKKLFNEILEEEKK